MNVNFNLSLNSESVDTLRTSLSNLSAHVSAVTESREAEMLKAYRKLLFIEAMPDNEFIPSECVSAETDYSAALESFHHAESIKNTLKSVNSILFKLENALESLEFDLWTEGISQGENDFQTIWENLET